MNKNIFLDIDNFEKVIGLQLNYRWLNFQKTALAELWMLTENDDDRDLIEFLIKNLFYVDSDIVNMASIEFVRQIEDVWKFSPENTIITAICDNSNPDGSQNIVQCMKNKFSSSKGWRENNFSNSIAVTVKELLKEDINIVLVDDFVGTGYTFYRLYNWLLDKVNKQIEGKALIKTMSLACMEFAKENISQITDTHYSYIWLKKGIEELAPEIDKERFRKSMELLESKLQQRLYGKKLPKFGFEKSESLYAFENYNIPNNVFPIFWWPKLKEGRERNTIFKRIF